MDYKYMSITDKQKASLDTLIYLDKFCKKNNYRYFLAYGTLLGAVRHQGFIPWDDDVDVFIPRPDYEQLLKKFHDQKGNYKLVSCYNDKEYIMPFAKIQNLNTARVLGDGSVDHQGLGIDLFPLDGIPQDLETAEATFIRENKKWRRFTNRLQYWRTLDKTTAINRIKRLLGSLSLHFGFLERSIKRLCLSPYEISYDDASTVGVVVGVHSGKFRAFDKKWFEKCSLEFEGHLLDAPAGFHEILTMVYSDYMKLPPEEKRVTTHSDKYIWKNG